MAYFCELRNILLFDIGIYYSSSRNCYYEYTSYDKLHNSDLVKYFYTVEELFNHRYYKQGYHFRRDIDDFITEYKIEQRDSKLNILL